MFGGSMDFKPVARVQPNLWRERNAAYNFFSFSHIRKKKFIHWEINFFLTLQREREKIVQRKRVEWEIEEREKKGKSARDFHTESSTAAAEGGRVGGE